VDPADSPLDVGEPLPMRSDGPVVTAVPPTIVSAVALGGVAAAVAALVLQPRRAWRDAAEHSRAFWLLWAIGWAALGVGAAVLAGPGWVGAAVLAAACLIGAAQPSMVADLLDVRGLGRLRRRQAWMAVQVSDPALPRVAWHAPSASTRVDPMAAHRP
jgi:hypothetical protein